MSEHARERTLLIARVSLMKTRVAQLMYQTKPTQVSAKSKIAILVQRSPECLFILYMCVRQGAGDLEVRISALGLMWYVSTKVVQVKTPRAAGAHTWFTQVSASAFVALAISLVRGMHV